MKTHSAKLLFILSVFLIFGTLKTKSQNKNQLSISFGITQLKDKFNQGMIFTGPMLGIKYGGSWNVAKYELSYKPEVNLGVSFNRNMKAASFEITPIDLSCMKSIIKKDSHTFKSGLNISANYNYQLYPDLQNGYLFWTSELGVSICLQYSYRWAGGQLNLHVQNSLLGFTSRPVEFDPYFYSLKFADFVCYAHQNLTFGSFNKYNHTTIQAEYTTGSSHSFGAGIDYLSVFYGIGFKRLNYSLQWKIKI